jgi:phosphotransferase system HPr (HPr) family protein
MFDGPGSRSNVVVADSVRIADPEGLHLRMCAAIVQLVGRYQAQVMVQKDDRLQDAASILGLLTLAAEKGTSLTVSASGPDAARVVPALVELLSAGTGLSNSRSLGVASV